jgi:tetratricopeptide (TPR) repeat protein
VNSRSYAFFQSKKNNRLRDIKNTLIEDVPDVSIDHKIKHLNHRFQVMAAIRKIAFFCVIIQLLLLLSPTVTAFDGRAVKFLDEGVSLSRQGHDTEAIASYDKAIAFEPNYADAWTHRGFSQSRLFLYSDALTSYDKAIELNPNIADEELWNQRGIALTQLGRYTEAIASYDKATAINPYDDMIKQNREIARGMAMQAEEAQLAQQKNKLIPLMYAPPGAIILMAGIAVWNRREGSK